MSKNVARCSKKYCAFVHSLNNLYWFIPPRFRQFQFVIIFTIKTDTYLKKEREKKERGAACNFCERAMACLDGIMISLQSMP